jgi:hypothetical protein
MCDIKESAAKHAEELNILPYEENRNIVVAINS